jgi:putative transposase
MRRIAFAEGEFYHLYNRGVDKRVVFTTAEEYRRFIAYLFLLNDTEVIRVDAVLKSSNGPDWKAKPSNPLVALGAYCLMPNHFHLYATPLVDGGVSKFMQRLQTAYTMYFNQKHERSGALFQGTFKARDVNSDAYARYLFSYIHLNPAKITEPKWQEFGSRELRKLSTFARMYPYSSLREYLGAEHIITDPSKFPEYLRSRKDVDEHIDEWLRLREEFLSEKN